MNKNIIVVGAIAAGLYLLSQGKKTTKVVAKKKAPQRPERKYPKPHPHLKPKPRTERVIAKKKAIYNKPKIKKAITRKKPTYYKSIPRRVIAKKKAIYNKPKIKKAITRKKPTYYKRIPRVAIARKQIIKRMAWRKRRR